MELWPKYKTQILIAGGIILVVVIVYLIGRAKGKKTPPKTYSFVNPGTGEQQAFNPGALTDALFKEMDGNSLLKWGGRTLAPYNEWLELNDNQFIAVAEDWRQRYYAQAESQTIFEKLAKEKDYEFTFGMAPFYTLRDKILKRAQNLNLY